MIDNLEYLEEGELKMVPEERRRAVILRKLGQWGEAVNIFIWAKIWKELKCALADGRVTVVPLGCY